MEFPDDPGHSGPSFADLLSADDCAQIDDEAYELSRSWYRDDKGADTLQVDGLGIGPATEYPATASLIRYLRAATILTRAAEEGIRSVELRSTGMEWMVAAHHTGLAIQPGSQVRREPVPTGAKAPSRATRLVIASMFSVEKGPKIALVGAPAWMTPYQLSIARRYSLHLVDPGLRIAARLMSRMRSASHEWLSMDGSGGSPLRLPIFGVEEGIATCIRSAVGPLLPSLKQAAIRGRRASSALILALASQDVLPVTRAYLLGLRAGGTAILTLEHGIGGSYRHQVHSVADHFAVWGPEQAAYHVPRQPAGLFIDVVGSDRIESMWRRGADGARWDVLYFAQPAPALSAGSWPSDHLRIMRMTENYARRHPKRRVAVKPHPSQRVYGPTASGQGLVRQVTGDASELIRHARAVVVATSTAGLEAMAIGRPVIQVEPDGETGLPSFLATSGAVRSVVTDMELEEAIERCLEDPSATSALVQRGRAFVRRFVAAVDVPGHSQRTILQLIADLSRA